MKTWVVTTVVFLAVLGSAPKARGQDSCIVPWPGTSFSEFDTLPWNTDSAYVDTCHSSATYLSKFCRRAYEVFFDWHVIHPPVYDHDTLLVNEWTAIDTLYSALRSSFQQLETNIGHFTLTMLYSNTQDTSSELNKEFIFRFDSLLNVDTIVSELRSIAGIHSAEWNGKPHFIVRRVIPNLPQQDIIAWPQPCRNELLIQAPMSSNDLKVFDELGKELHVPIRNSSDKLLQLDVSSVPNGLLYIYTSNGVLKILKQK